MLEEKLSRVSQMAPAAPIKASSFTANQSYFIQFVGEHLGTLA
jgi:hypothetical protein